MTSVFKNIDYLFWRSLHSVSEIPWIMWYIWKARNDRVFKNVDQDSREILQMADTEASLWLAAQTSNQEGELPAQAMPLYFFATEGPQCHIDGSWKEEDIVSGLGWYYLQDTNTGY